MQSQPAHQIGDVTAEFMTHRPKLYAIAYRTLGSPWLADDAVQETWVRLQRADIGSIEHLEAWLTTVVSRVCIDMIRQQSGRREDPAGDDGVDTGSATSAAMSTDPLDAALRLDDLAIAMQVVLDTLGPLERLALVLHDVFALSYNDIAPIVERTAPAARQLASRARARLRTVDVTMIRRRQDAAIKAFLNAARQGNFGELLQLLDPEIEVRSDDAALQLAAGGADHGAPLLDHRLRGVDAVSRAFAGRAMLVQPVTISGVPAAVYISDETVQALYLVRFAADRIAGLDVLADPERLEPLTATMATDSAAARGR